MENIGFNMFYHGLTDQDDDVTNSKRHEGGAFPFTSGLEMQGGAGGFKATVEGT